MSINPGARLGPYEIISALGAGGMGEVYRARDTRLDRDVAIKILPAAFASDATRLHRFAQEARATAALSHPNILAIHDVSTEGTPYVVYELLHGETLRERLTAGPMPVRKAIDAATHIARGLAAAHDKGIVHRDLKPENLFITTDGHVKILDFGLAKLLPRSSLTISTGTLPTAAPDTEPGMMLGTVGYMSPEQVRGEDADHRSDIFALGAVLYEMLSGARAFGGETSIERLNAILKAEPPPLPAGDRNIPPAVERIVSRMLEKRPADRFKSADDLAFALDALSAPSGATPAMAEHHTPRSRARTIGQFAAAFAVGGAVLATVLWRPANGPASAPVVSRLPIALPDGYQFTGNTRSEIAISPDGTRIAYAANNRLYIRSLSELEAVSIPGTEVPGLAGVRSSTLAPRNPFFSPDGQWLGFSQGGSIKKVALGGGIPLEICPVSTSPFGVVWGPDGTIFYSLGAQGVWRVGSGGGTPEKLFEDPSGPVGSLQLLPGGWLLYTLNSGGRWEEDGQIAVRSLDSGDNRVVVKGGTDARYVRPGYLVYLARATLVAVRFDLQTLSATGGPMPLVDGIAQGSAGAAQFSVSETGSLIYIPRTPTPTVSRTLVWVDRLGRESPIGVESRNYIYARVSPDGRRAAVDDRSDVWVIDFARETLTRLTTGAEQDFYGIWAPDGRDLVFASGPSGPEGPHNLYRQSADGKGAAERLTNSRVNQVPLAVTPDGHTVIFRSGTVEQFDIHALSLSAPRTDSALLSTRFSERNAALSPDGRWIAYESDQSGRMEVYVRPFPKVDDGQSQVSSKGGSYPVWSRNTSELFYASPDGSIMAAAVRTEPNFSVAPATRLFAGAYSMNEPGRTFDVGPDGRFLMIKGGPPALSDTRMVLVQNWVEELKSRVPLTLPR